MRKTSSGDRLNILLLWLGVVCAGCAWTCWSGVYVSTYRLAPYESWFAYVLAGAGLSAFTLCLRKIHLSVSSNYYWLLAPLVLFGLLVPHPYCLGPWVLVSGLVLFLCGRNNRVFRSLVPGILLFGLLLSLESLLVPLWYYLGCHSRGLPWMASLLVHVFSFLGMTCSSNGPTLYAKYGGDYRIIQVTADAIGLLPGLFILVGITLWGRIKNQGKSYRGCLRILSLWVSYLLARYVVLLWIFLGWSDRATITMMWNAVCCVISFMPLAVILALSRTGFDWTRSGRLSWAGLSRHVLGWTILVCIAAMAAVFGSSLTDPGDQKGGRILIDEGHSDWEDTMQPFDTNWYGQASTYNYYCLRTFLENYYELTVNLASITPDTLKNQDVVIVKVPTRSYSEEELRAMEAFVREGGGLFLVGDHTDVFGTSTILNTLAERFDLSFEKNGQWDIYGQFSVYKQPQTLGHPVGKHTPEFLFATGCTLSARVWHEKPIIGYGMMTRLGNYRNKNFFPDDAHYEDREYGLFLQSAGTFVGQGRVLCFTDSTVWSNFSMFYQGKPELLLDCLMWLNRSNTWWAHAKPYVLLLSVVVIVAALLLTPSSATLREHHAFVLSCIMPAIVISCGFVNLSHRWFYQQPSALKDYKKITFDSEHSDIFLANRFWYQEKSNSKTLGYGAFFVSAQRLGIVPQVRDAFLQALEGDKDPVVIVNPHKRFSKTETKAFQDYISQGGKALVLDASDRSEASFARQLLEPLAVEIVYDQAGGANEDPVYRSYLFSEDRDRERSVSFPAHDICEVRGGKPVLWYVPAQDSGEAREEDWKPCLSEVSFGKGKVWVCTLSKAFSGLGLGDASAIPNRHQQNIYRLVFKILNHLCDE